MKNKWRRFIALCIGLIGALSAGCGVDTGQSGDFPLTPLVSVTSIVTDNGQGALAAAPKTTIEPPEPTEIVEVLALQTEATTLPIEGETDVIEPDVIEPSYRVHFIEDNDVLNIRSGPGVTYPIVGELKLATADLRATGAGQVVRNSLWFPIQHNDASGWVNSRYLVEEVSAEDFCADGDSRQVVEKLLHAVDTGDGALLAELVEEGRPLRIRRHWWNPEAILDSNSIPGIFASTQSYDWGTADGSGDTIVGTFDASIKPLLEKNLIGATEIGCGAILHGGTAGIVQLPNAYEGISFYSLYRPAGPDEFEMDWGTWVVGIETWKGVYRLTFLVHYEWEI
jgi:hypothetical protein